MYSITVYFCLLLDVWMFTFSSHYVSYRLSVPLTFVKTVSRGCFHCISALWHVLLCQKLSLLFPVLFEVLLLLSLAQMVLVLILVHVGCCFLNYWSCTNLLYCCTAAQRVVILYRYLPFIMKGSKGKGTSRVSKEALKPVDDRQFFLPIVPLHVSCVIALMKLRKLFGYACL